MSIAKRSPRFLGSNAEYYRQAFGEARFAGLGEAGLIRVLSKVIDIVPFLESSRYLRSVEALAMEHLELVPGIGPKTAKRLVNKFGSLEAIGSASMDELTKVRYVTRKIAVSLRRRFSDL